ncbi:protein-tyrosine-phosphatase [Dyella tabacisoli]|uniref:Protein-tyrosine-phosphatase n=1 Tax=Dyella tabacisoli TaxID=2282381 RepID=A0A369UQ35_9GAMM|nr:protein-tyrosine-phosphatase [Dyella tabacisoli]
MHNTRDLGGIVAANGQSVQKGRLFRSGNPGLATESDIQYLQKLNLEVVLDFRTAEEKSPKEQAFAKRFNWVADPVLSGDMSVNSMRSKIKTSTPEQMDMFMRQTYRDLPVKYQTQFTAFLKLAEQNKTMLYHCTAGKDRTGFATLLLLSALGVDRDTIMANYLESNRYNESYNQMTMSVMQAQNIDPKVLAQVLTVKKEYLQAAMQSIDEKYGGMDHYLRHTLGIDVELLRKNYLNSQP